MLPRRISFNVFVYLIVFLFGTFSFALKFQTLQLVQDSVSPLVILDLLRSESSLYFFLLFFSSALLSKSSHYLIVRRVFVFSFLVITLFSAYSLSIFEFLSSESVSLSKGLYWLDENKNMSLEKESVVIFLLYLLPALLLASVLFVFFFCLGLTNENSSGRKHFLIKIGLAVLFLIMGFVSPVQKVLPYSISHNPLLYLFKSALNEDDQQFERIENASYADWQVTIKKRHPEKNLVIVILDSMQSDVLKVYSPDESQHPMPYLQALSQESLVFEQAYASVPNTSKALIPIFCGILPSLELGFPESVNGLAVSCLPEIMNRYFYRSVFFQGERAQKDGRGDLLKQMGFQEIFSAETYRPDKQFESNPERFDDEYTLDYAKSWVSRNYNKRFVMGFLLSNNAYPYQVPAKSGFTTYSTQKSRNAHLNALHYSDAVIKQLLDEFKQKGIYQDTVFVFLSAHGEAFGEHGLQQHNNVAYNQVSKVLFMIHDGAHLFEKGIGNTTVSQLQILPSVLNVLGLEASGRALPESVFQGGNRAIGSCYEPATCQFYADSNYKYIDNFNEKSPELFNLEMDPDEKNNLVLEKPDIAESMRFVLESQMQFHQSALQNYYDKNAEEISE